MSRSQFFKFILFGFLSWLIPFAVSFLFYTRDGQLLTTYGFFKSMMIVTGSLSGCALMILYFLKIDRDFLRYGAIIGFGWLFINLILDAIVLVPMMKQSFSDYFASIGLGYFMIPILALTLGYLLDQKTKHVYK